MHVEIENFIHHSCLETIPTIDTAAITNEISFVIHWLYSLIGFIKPNLLTISVTLDSVQSSYIAATARDIAIFDVHNDLIWIANAVLGVLTIPSMRAFERSICVFLFKITNQARSY